MLFALIVILYMMFLFISPGSLFRVFIFVVQSKSSTYYALFCVVFHFESSIP